MPIIAKKIREDIQRRMEEIRKKIQRQLRLSFPNFSQPEIKPEFPNKLSNTQIYMMTYSVTHTSNIRIPDRAYDTVTEDEIKEFFREFESFRERLFEMVRKVKFEIDCDDFSRMFWCKCKKYFISKGKNVPVCMVDVEGHSLNGVIVNNVFRFIEPQRLEFVSENRRVSRVWY